MDINQLKYFVSAATLGSFSEAAIENNISQSAFSKQIMSLENEMGVKLFSRKQRSISLTSAGSCFLEHAYGLLGNYNKMRKDLAKYKEDESDFISIASIPVLSQYKITDAVLEFRRIHPNISFNLMEAESDYVLLSLRKMESQFGIMRTDFLDFSQFDYVPLISDRLVAVVPEKHPLAKQETISLAQLGKERLIFPTPKSDLYNICMRTFAQGDIQPNIAYTISGKLDLTIDFVRKGEALAVIMERVIGSCDTTGCKMIPLEGNIRSITALVWMKNIDLIPNCKIFKKFLQTLFKNENSINN